MPKRNPVKKGAKMRSPYDNKTKEQQPKESEDIESHPTIANPTKDIEDTKKVSFIYFPISPVIFAVFIIV